jgi:hypothetical protein
VSLDLLLDWTGRLRGGPLRGAAFGAYLQLHNVHGRENETVYTSSRSGCVQSLCGPRVRLGDRYEKGISRLPVVGLRVRF